MDLLKGIKNIIFDLGGVIINVDENKTIQALKQLKFNNVEKFYTDVNISEKLIEYELGAISDDEFLIFIKKYCSSETTTNEIISAWNAMLLDIPQQRILLLNDLKKDYKIYILSNTNHLHYLTFSDNFKKATGGIEINNFFNKTFYSFQLKMRKPNINVYKYVLDTQKLNPKETLFIDDKLENIETATMLNIKSHWLKEELVDVFKITSLQQKSVENY